MNLELFKKEMEARLSPRRMSHTVGCAELARQLASRWGADEDFAYAAGLLHDMTKEVPIPEQLKFCEKHGIIISDTQKQVPELIHAITGAKAAEIEFGVPNEIQNAILWHTTGKPDMSLLEKIIWMADLIEPGRKFPGVDEIRAMAFESLDRAILMGIDRTVMYLAENKRIIDPTMIEARNWLIPRVDV